MDGGAISGPALAALIAEAGAASGGGAASMAALAPAIAGGAGAGMGAGAGLGGLGASMASSPFAGAAFGPGAGLGPMGAAGGALGSQAIMPAFGVLPARGGLTALSAKDLMGIANQVKRDERGTPQNPMTVVPLMQPPQVLPFSSLNPYVKGGRPRKVY